jgi:uncharacterized protein (TIGR02391 family)
MGQEPNEASKEEVMVVRVELDEKLAEAVSEKFEKGDNRGAILESVMFLSETIRERAGLESDGVSLMNEAFGGSNPKLKVTEQRNQSEKDIQQGIASILRGIIQAIRNPRSHERGADSKDDAQAILAFVSYLLGVITKAKAPFEIETFLRRLIDPDFVRDGEYAALVVNEIPRHRLYETLIAVFDGSEDINANVIRYITEAIFDKLDANEMSEFSQLASKELRLANEESKIRAAIAVFNGNRWIELDKDVRLRIENRLIKEVTKGSYNKSSGKYLSGSIGTWIRSILDQMESKDKLTESVIDKLLSEEPSQEDYVIAVFGTRIFHLTDKMHPGLIGAIRTGLEAGKRKYLDLINEEKSSKFPPWFYEIESAYNNFKEEDEIPF